MPPPPLPQEDAAAVVQNYPEEQMMELDEGLEEEMQAVATTVAPPTPPPASKTPTPPATPKIATTPAKTTPAKTTPAKTTPAKTTPSPKPSPQQQQQPQPPVPKTKSTINQWGDSKPPISYAGLIALVLTDLPGGRATLKDLNQHVIDNFPFYAPKSRHAQWQNSIRHNLSLHKDFMRIEKDGGRGGFWTLKPGANKEALVRVRGGKDAESPRRPEKKVAEETSTAHTTNTNTITTVTKVTLLPPPQLVTAPIPQMDTMSTMRSPRKQQQSLEEFLQFGAEKVTFLSAIDCDNKIKDAKTESVPMPPPSGAKKEASARPRAAPAPPPPSASSGKFTGSMDYWEQGRHSPNYS
jgi:hypothetical protein